MENKKDKLKELKKFWGGKKVFLTGHTGFKGSWMCVLLSILGAKVIGYSLSPSKNGLFFKGKIHKLNHKNIYKNILNYKSLYKTIRLNKPDLLIHMAAQPLVKYSYENPELTFNTNTVGTLNVLSSIKKTNSIRSSIIITTDKVYKNNSKSNHSENDELAGYDPYSSSKVCAEIVSETYKNCYFKNSKSSISTARSGNVIGGGDFSKDRLIPDIFRVIKTKKILKIRMPKAVRPWQHVIEPLVGYLFLLEKQYKNKKKFDNLGYGWNFGPNKENLVSVIKIVKYFKKIYKFNLKIKKKDFIETNILKLSNNKSRRYLGWQPKWNLNKTLEKILEWEDLKNRKTNLTKICKKQILSYFYK